MKLYELIKIESKGNVFHEIAEVSNFMKERKYVRLYHNKYNDKIKICCFVNHDDYIVLDYVKNFRKIEVTNSENYYLEIETISSIFTFQLNSFLSKVILG